MLPLSDLPGCFWAGLIERISWTPRRPGCPEVGRLAPRRVWWGCARSRGRWRKERAWRSPARRLASPSRTQGRGPETGDLLQLERGSGRDRGLDRSRQPGAAALVLGLPATRARDPRLRQPPTHTTDHAVVSQNSVLNPGQVTQDFRARS